MSMRVHELAKKLGIPSKALVEKLQTMKVDVKNHMSVVPEEIVSKLEGAGKKEIPKTKEKPPKARERSPKEVKTKDDATRLLEKRAFKKVREKEALQRKEAVKESPKGKSPEPTLKKAPTSKEAPQAEVKKEDVAPLPEKPKTLKTIQLHYPIALKDLATKIGIKPNELIKSLISKKIFATINQSLEESVVESLAEEFGFFPDKLPTTEESLILEHEHEKEDPKKLKPRAPIVTLMGHVDHGKTSLLDAIRKSDVAGGEVGGITQHIGAHEVFLEKGHVTFLDTPGHEAFTAMRARGANVTDVVVLVVAADDGLMPQTEEAIDHAKAAEVPLVVAINKCDLPGANVDRVKQQLNEQGLVPEDWGGKTIMVPVSAKTKEGIPALLEMLLLESELLELKANPSKKAKGTVLESEISKGKGPVARVLIQDGTLRIGDVVVCGLYHGKVRAMFDDRGRQTPNATPSRPVEVLGLSGVPEAGDRLYVVKDEKTAREIVSQRQEVMVKEKTVPARHLTLEDLHDQIQEGKVKEVKFIVKADVQGSFGALKGEILKIESKDIKLSVIHSGVGEINESDIMLGAASDAVVIGFHVGVHARAEAVAKKEGVEIKLYNIIYEAISEIKLAIEGLLEPVTKETFLGRAEVKQVFKISKIGNIAGCLAIKGKLNRSGNPLVRVVREKEVIFEGKLSALKRFKDDVKEVTEGQECGISVENFKNFKEGDWIELYRLEKVAQKLGAPSS